MSTFFDNLGLVITELLSLFTQVSTTLIGNELFQIGLGFFVIGIIVSIIMKLLNRNKSED